MTDLADSYTDEIDNRTKAFLDTDRRRDFAEFLSDNIWQMRLVDAIRDQVRDELDTTSGVKTDLTKIVLEFVEAHERGAFPESDYDEQKEQAERENRRDAYNDSRVSEQKERMAMGR